MPKDCSEQMLRVLERMLHPDYKERPTAEELLRHSIFSDTSGKLILSHSWIISRNMNNDRDAYRKYLLANKDFMSVIRRVVNCTTSYIRRMFLKLLQTQLWTICWLKYSWTSSCFGNLQISLRHQEQLMILMKTTTKPQIIYLLLDCKFVPLFWISFSMVSDTIRRNVLCFSNIFLRQTSKIPSWIICQTQRPRNRGQRAPLPFQK